jgi:Concanavalin A-like lectin/glucanases superfamily/Fibronectin type III domain
VLALDAAPAGAATSLYPDLKTLPPRDLRFDRTDVDPDGGGVIHNVLRFTNVVWDVGPGPLELRTQIDPTTNSGPAMQRVYDDAGNSTDYPAGNFYYHAAHKHYHYDDWGRYELWTKAAYDTWIANGRTGGSPMLGSKTSSCMVDEEFVRQLPHQPYPPVYRFTGCQPDSQNRMIQGISPGWGDNYDYFRFEQWIDLGANGSLADGQYVLRSVTDPDNKLYESPNKSDPSKESDVDNEATTTFTIQNGQILDSDPPSGSVMINNIDSATANPGVIVKVLGRDDVSGVTQVRLSNNGSAWSNPQSYTGSGSTPQSVTWDLTNATYGGNGSDGTKTVYAEFKDASGKWSSPESDTIKLDRTGGSSPYSNAVLGNDPAAYWRLGDTSGATAVDATGLHNGTYTNGAALGQPSLLAGDSANTSVKFDGANDYVAVPSAGSLSPSARVSLEAWIKPSALPAAGSFASVLTKRESYSLQFNGPRLEFTIIQSGTRRRLQAPAGAVQVGQTYHVVGTYDGTTQRLYINGAQTASQALTGAISTNANSVTIGSWSGSTEFLNGVIDEPAVYTGVLSPSQISAHYQAGIGGPPPNPTVAAPSNLSATAVSDTRIDLRWNDNSSNEDEFVIERDTNSGFTSPTTNTAWADSTTLSDTGLAPGTTYYYRVKAKNPTDSSGWSNTASATTPAYRSTVLADSPVSYWRLGETTGTTAADERAANPGVYQQSPTLGVASLLASDSANKAVGFDGTNDRIQVTSSSSLNLTSHLTLEAWIKPTALPSSGSFKSIISKAGSYSLQFNGPRLELTIIQSGTKRRLQAASGAIQTGHVYHVVGTYNGTTQRLYINGSQVASQALSGGASVTGNSLFIGSWNLTSEFFKGTIDEAAVYGSALSASRVAAHHSAGTG